MTELPYMVNKARLIEKIADLVKEKKIRNSEKMKVPYTLVVGSKEVAERTLTPRIRTDFAVEGRSESSYDVDQFMSSVANEVRGRVSVSSL